jgi:hypothetical protein
MLIAKTTIYIQKKIDPEEIQAIYIRIPRQVWTDSANFLDPNGEYIFELDPIERQIIIKELKKEISSQE